MSVAPVEVAAGVRIGGGAFAIFAGPCVIEGEREAIAAAEMVRSACAEAGLSVVYKSSFDKANRTAVGHYRGPGLEKGLAILARVKAETGLPVLSDVHEVGQVEAAARVLDVIQIPAYLSQQTDLVVAVARTGKCLNIKKGQFMSPWDVRKVAEKAVSAGAHRILLCERGTTFGYNNLVVDMRALPIMQESGFPVLLDATHAVRLPGIPSNEPSGGLPQYIEPLARAGVAAGADGLFLETHPDPARALCDAASQLPLSRLAPLLADVRAIRDALQRSRTPASAVAR